MTSKIKHETLCNSFEEGGLRNVDIKSKVASLQCSWIKRLYDGKFHEWKLIAPHLIICNFGINFKFHSNLDFDDSKVLTFPSFYKQLFCKWYLPSFVNIASSILSQPIWYNKNIKINSKPIYVEEFAKQNIIFLYDLFNPLNAKFIKWSNTLKQIVGKLPTICLSVFDHFSGLALKGLTLKMSLKRGMK